MSSLSREPEPDPSIKALRSFLPDTTQVSPKNKGEAVCNQDEADLFLSLPPPFSCSLPCTVPLLLLLLSSRHLNSQRTELVCGQRSKAGEADPEPKITTPELRSFLASRAGFLFPFPSFFFFEHSLTRLYFLPLCSLLLTSPSTILDPT